MQLTENETFLKNWEHDIVHFQFKLKYFFASYFMLNTSFFTEFLDD